MTTGPDDDGSTQPPPPSGAGAPPPNPYGGSSPSPYGAPPQPYGSQPQPYGAQPQPYGQPGYPMPGYVAAPPNDGLGLGAMIVGIVSLVLACGYGIGLLGAPAALIMGRISLKRIDRSQGQLGGRGMAMAGFVMGIVGTVLLVLLIAVVVVIVIVAVNGGFDSSSDY